MEKHKKLNIISAAFILLAFVVAYVPFLIPDLIYGNPIISYITGYFWLLAPPIFCITAFAMSIKSLRIKESNVDVGFVLIVLSIVAFFTTNFFFLCWITGYRG